MNLKKFKCAIKSGKDISNVFESLFKTVDTDLCLEMPKAYKDAYTKKPGIKYICGTTNLNGEKVWHKNTCNYDYVFKICCCFVYNARFSLPVYVNEQYYVDAEQFAMVSVWI